MIFPTDSFLDRTGVAMGLEFQYGHILDQMAADAVSAGRVKPGSSLP